jgi:hypothetical protein
MPSAALFALLLAADPAPATAPTRLLDDATLRVAAERSAELGERLRVELPEARQALRPRAEALLTDARRDLDRLRRGGPVSPTAEAAVVFNYGELCKLAADVLGPEKVTFKPNPYRPSYVEDTAKLGFIKINKQAFAQTLQNPDEIAAALKATRELLKALKAKARRDALQTAKWHRDLAKLEAELNQAAYDLIEPGNLSKVPAEAAVYGLHARFVGMMVSADR